MKVNTWEFYSLNLFSTSWQRKYTTLCKAVHDLQIPLVHWTELQSTLAQKVRYCVHHRHHNVTHISTTGCGRGTRFVTKYFRMKMTQKTFIIEDLIQVLFYQIKNRFSACTFLSTSLVLWYSYMNNTEYGVSRGSKIHIFCEVILLLVSREKRRGLLVRWYSDWRKRERNVSGRDIDVRSLGFGQL